MVPPPSAARLTCSPRRAKSADKIEGASSINLGLSGEFVGRFYHAGQLAKGPLLPVEHHDVLRNSDAICLPRTRHGHETFQKRWNLMVLRLEPLMNGKVVLVTGADGGLGTSVTQAFLDAGAT